MPRPFLWVGAFREALSLRPYYASSIWVVSWVELHRLAQLVPYEYLCFLCWVYGYRHVVVGLIKLARFGCSCILRALPFFGSASCYVVDRCLIARRYPSPIDRGAKLREVLLYLFMCNV